MAITKADLIEAIQPDNDLTQKLSTGINVIGNQGRGLMTPDDLIGFKGNHIKLSVDNVDLGIAAATDIAKKKAKELSDDPMLLSWYCGKTGEYYPKTECGRTDKPPWIIFAESRGADIAININDGEYVFLYLSL